MHFFDFRDNMEGNGRINNFIYTNEIEKSNPQEGRLYYGSLTGSCSWCFLLKIRAGKSHFSPSFPPKPGRKSCSLMHRTAVTWELCPSCSGHLPGTFQVFILTGNGLSPDWQELGELTDQVPSESHSKGSDWSCNWRGKVSEVKLDFVALIGIPFS